MPEPSDEIAPPIREYGRELLAYALKQRDTLPEGRLGEIAQDLSQKDSQAKQSRPLLSIISQLNPQSRAYYQLKPLGLEREVLFPRPNEPKFSKEDLDNHWKAFEAEAELIKDNSLEGFGYLMRKYGWCIAAPQGGDISLYQFFKLAAAVYSCEQRGSGLLVVSGDVPGIQRWLYNVQSQRAGKALRGRSFFLQLLADALGRSLLNKFGLSRLNLLYQGGGNFSLLLPAMSNEGQDAGEIVLEKERDFNRTLWEKQAGLLRCVLASTSTMLEDFATEPNEVYRQAKDALQLRKNQYDLDYDRIFAPKHPENWNAYESTEERRDRLNESNWMFSELAMDLAGTDTSDKKPRWLIIAPGQSPALTEDENKSNQEMSWESLLADLSGFSYSFENKPPSSSAQSYLINDTNFTAGNQSGDGFIFIGNTTPRMTDDEIANWQPDPTDPEERRPAKTHIRDVDRLADAAQGFKRHGILRMDVDSLGAAFGSSVTKQVGGRESLSEALGLFFEGYLNELCRRFMAEKEEDQNTLYTLYSGGDDLFIVGSWDRLPRLALEIRSEFAKFSSGNLSISGGIVLAQGDTYPLYQLAHDADEAEKKAKRFERYDQNKAKRLEKNACAFLGTPLSWDELARVQADAFELCRLVDKQTAGAGLNKAVLMNILDIYRQAMAGANGDADQIQTGRWFWRAAYNLSQSLKQAQKENKTEGQTFLRDLKTRILDEHNLQNIRLIGLAARWADFLTR